MMIFLLNHFSACDNWAVGLVCLLASLSFETAHSTTVSQVW